jgi:hypothetical protein
MAGPPVANTFSPRSTKGDVEMAKLSMQDKDKVQDHGPVTVAHDEIAGQSVDIVRFNVEIDHAPLLKGLPDDRCPCPHWGYVVKGRITYQFADREEIHEAGDAFYVEPGHVPIAEAGTEYVQFSPAKELEVVSAKIQENMQAMQGA